MADLLGAQSAMPNKKQVPLSTGGTSAGGGLLGNWQPTVTPTQQPPGFFDSLSAGINSARTNPTVQFGLGMAGAGGQGQGLGGGLLGGANAAPNAFKFAAQQRELAAQKQRDQFIVGLSDPNNPIAKNLSPETLATLKGLPPDQSSDLLARLLSRKGDLEQERQIAGIQANAQVNAKIKELQYQRQYGLDMMSRFAPPPVAGPGAGQPPRPQSQAEVDALPPGTTWIAPDGSLRRR